MVSQAHIPLTSADEHDSTPMSLASTNPDVTPCTSLASKVHPAAHDGSAVSENRPLSGFADAAAKRAQKDKGCTKLLSMLAAAQRKLRNGYVKPRAAPVAGSKKEKQQTSARPRTTIEGQRPAGARNLRAKGPVKTGEAKRTSEIAVQSRPMTANSFLDANSGAKTPGPVRQEPKPAKISEYSLGNQIGQGAYAVVKQGIHKATGRKVAVKIYEKYKIADAQRKTSVNREIKLLQRLNHGNVVKLYETIDTPRQLFLVMELIKGRSLHSYVRGKAGRKLEEGEALKIFRQIADGIAYCHKNNVVHRDIKMENILVDEELNVRIIDFGFSICAASNQRLKIFCGTPSYMAPEIVNRQEYIGFPADMWSLGILLFALVCGNFPFKGTTDHELFRNISKGQISFPSFVSATVKGIVSKLLKQDPQARATAKEIAEDPLLRGNEKADSAVESRSDIKDNSAGSTGHGFSLPGMQRRARL